jgi:hypothetical protein
MKLAERLSGNEVTLAEVSDYLGHAAVLDVFDRALG